MKMRVALLCGAVLLLSSGAQADEVDDLLAGRSIGSSQETSIAPAEEAASPSPAEAFDHSEIHKPATLENQPAWHAGVPAELPHGTVAAATDESASPLELSLVPEPSAIGLAGLALVYFLVFFRRRQLA